MLTTLSGVKPELLLRLAESLRPELDNRRLFQADHSFLHQPLELIEEFERFLGRELVRTQAREQRVESQRRRRGGLRRRRGGEERQIVGELGELPPLLARLECRQ